jgi:hypothetical protein
MIRAIIVLVSLAATLPAAQAPPSSVQPAQDPAQPAALQQLIATMREREQSAKSAQLTMRTKGSYPGGITFEITGTVRVLGTTHFQVKTKAAFEDEMTVESETVKTPEGVWMREKDQIHGEVFTRMEPALMQRLEEASAALGEGPPLQGGLGGKGIVPVGSAVLEAMDKSYELAVQDRRIDGNAYYVVAGPVRGGIDAEDAGLPIAARVELLVRQRDLIVERMSHFDAAGEETMRVEILELELDAPLEPESFVLVLPAGQSFIDVMDHLPAATQINAQLERYEEKRRGAAGEAAGDPDKAGTGKKKDG